MATYAMIGPRMARRMSHKRAGGGPVRTQNWPRIMRATPRAAKTTSSQRARWRVTRPDGAFMTLPVSERCGGGLRVGYSQVSASNTQGDHHGAASRQGSGAKPAPGAGPPSNGKKSPPQELALAPRWRGQNGPAGTSFGDAGDAPLDGHGAGDRFARERRRRPRAVPRVVLEAVEACAYQDEVGVT